MTEQREPSLLVDDVHKSFGQVRALTGVTLAAFPGEIHAVVGDNGAGKSTMMKVITGMCDRDEGEVHILGELLEKGASAQTAIESGVAPVYQDLALVECLDLATNLCLSDLPTRFGLFLHRSRIRREARDTLKQVRSRVQDVSTPIGLLSGGQRQIIAVARALRMDKPIVVLDEPTASLGVQERALVGELLNDLRDAQKTLLCISHDLEFVFTHSDRITVLRLGRSVGTRETKKTSREEIVGMITGVREMEAS